MATLKRMFFLTGSLWMQFRWTMWKCRSSTSERVPPSASVPEHSNMAPVGTLFTWSKFFSDIVEANIKTLCTFYFFPNFMCTYHLENMVWFQRQPLLVYQPLCTFNATSATTWHRSLFPASLSSSCRGCLSGYTWTPFPPEFPWACWQCSPLLHRVLGYGRLYPVCLTLRR